MSEAERERIYEQLVGDERIDWAVCILGPPVIDEINILQATMRAMEGVRACVCCAYVWHELSPAPHDSHASSLRAR